MVAMPAPVRVATDIAPQHAVPGNLSVIQQAVQLQVGLQVNHPQSGFNAGDVRHPVRQRLCVNATVPERTIQDAFRRHQFRAQCLGRCLHTVKNGLGALPL